MFMPAPAPAPEPAPAAVAVAPAAAATTAVAAAPAAPLAQPVARVFGIMTWRELGGRECVVELGGCEYRDTLRVERLEIR